jgi:serine/threonine protein kinase
MPQAGSSQTTDRPSAIFLRPLTKISSSERPNDNANFVALQWIRKRYQHSTTCSVHKVEIAFDPRSERLSEPTFFAVKELKESHRKDFEKEVNLFAQVAEASTLPAIVQCYGTFDHYDHEGQMTHNLLLEYAQGDLWRYWKDNSPPRTSSGITNLYSELCNTLAAIQLIHSLNVESEEIQRFRHGDIKPENILRFTCIPESLGILKIADFGTSLLEPSHSGLTFSCQGGTRVYSMFSQW